MVPLPSGWPSFIQKTEVVQSFGAYLVMLRLVVANSGDSRCFLYHTVRVLCVLLAARAPLVRLRQACGRILEHRRCVSKPLRVLKMHTGVGGCESEEVEHIEWIPLLDLRLQSDWWMRHDGSERAIGLGLERRDNDGYRVR